MHRQLCSWYPLDRRWVDPRAGLDAVGKRKFLTLPGLEVRPLGRPARSQSLYRLRYPGLRGRSSSPGRVKNFLFSTVSRPALGSTQPPIQLVPGALSHRVKRQGRETDHSPAANAEVKKMPIYTHTPPYAFMA
jgi:hypothetical protein